MTRLHTTVRNAGMALILLTCTNFANATIYQDWWYNPSLSGMGLNVGQQAENIFVSWYMYDADGLPSFLLFYGNLQNNKTLTAPLRRYYGPEPPDYDETLWGGEVVGQATITFSSPSAGTFNYQYDGNQGSFAIQRFTFHPVNISGMYLGASIVTVSKCGVNDGVYAYPDMYNITHNGNSLSVAESSTGCVYGGTIQQQGTHFSGSGTFECTSTGESGTWSSSDISFSEFAMTGRMSAQNNFGCELDVRVGGIK